MFLSVLKRLLLTLACVLLPAVALAQDCVLPQMRTADRPVPPDGGPTKIISSIIVADFLGVDDVNQQMDLDLLIHLRWTDARFEGLEGCRFPVSAVWAPRAVLFNSSNLRAARINAAAAVDIKADGLVDYKNRFTGLISSYHNLRDFPFDRHDFLIEIGTIDRPIEEIVFVPDVEGTWITDKLNIEGWDVGGIAIRSEPQFYRESGKQVSVLQLIISAKRNPDYYIFRVLGLLAFVVAMSWTVFWVPPSRFEFQIGLGATSMLTGIAFSLAIASSLPPLGYLTILDRMLIWSVLLIFLSIAQSLYTGLLVQRDREAEAEQLDRYCRVIFPLALFGGWGALVASV